MSHPIAYRPSQVALHWLIFLLFLVALVCIEWRGLVPRDGNTEFRALLRAFHVNAGLLVLPLAIVRIYQRIVFRVPAIIATSPAQRVAAEALHGVLYLVMLALPLTGVIFSQAGGREVAFFGMALPQMVAQSPELRSVVKEVHEFIGNAVYWLVGLHIIASLWHHIVLKDDTLRRMRPSFGAKS